jgi:hypothetical protein
VLGSLVRDLVPSQYRERVPLVVHADQLYSLAVFSEDVVRLPVVSTALDELPAAVPLIPVARHLTVEARALLTDRSAIVVTRGECGWTEASYSSIRK